jgi:hypothetical protein
MKFFRWLVSQWVRYGDQLLFDIQAKMCPDSSVTDLQQLIYIYNKRKSAGWHVPQNKKKTEFRVHLSALLHCRFDLSNVFTVTNNSYIYVSFKPAKLTKSGVKNVQVSKERPLVSRCSFGCMIACAILQKRQQSAVIKASFSLLTFNCAK